MSGFWKRIAVAFRSFFSILFHADIPEDTAQKVVKTTGPVRQVPAAAEPSGLRLQEDARSGSEASGRAVQMLALLQRDGRLVDFLAEDISVYPDAQLGAAVRTIHETCRQVLDHYLKMEPILNSEE